MRQEENERFYGDDFFKKVFPETQNILRHIREVGFLRPPQVDAFEFYVEYYDELEGRWRRYYPDFMLKLKNNGWAVVEVKQADQTTHPNVVAKEQAARELFEKLNSIHYIIKRDDEIRRGMFQDIIAAGSSNG
ncbi:TnsA endonuclease N-terminal domain-containing protein [Moorellaceae bacterium AZ2]